MRKPFKACQQRAVHHRTWRGKPHFSAFTIAMAGALGSPSSRRLGPNAGRRWRELRMKRAPGRGGQAPSRLCACAGRGLRRCADGRGHSSGEAEWPHQMDAGYSELVATLRLCSAIFNGVDRWRYAAEGSIGNRSRLLLAAFGPAFTTTSPGIVIFDVRSPFAEICTDSWPMLSAVERGRPWQRDRMSPVMRGLIACG
jgi:hypothetical protein